MATLETVINQKIEQLKLKFLSSRFMLKKLALSIKEKYEKHLPVPLVYLEKKITPSEKVKYYHYLILVEQLILHDKLDKYVSLFVFNYDTNHFNIDESLKELKDIILVKESILLDDLTKRIIEEIN